MRWVGKPNGDGGVSEEVAEDDVSGSELALDVFAGAFPRFGAERVAGADLAEYRGGLLRILDAESSACGDDLACLDEFSVARPEYHRDAVDGCLVDIVQPAAECSADPCRIAVAVDG